MATKTLGSKILTTLIIASLLSIVLAICGILGVNHVARTANMTINQRMPIMKCSMRAQNAILLGSSIIDQVLLLQQHDDIDKIRILEGKFRNSLIIFDMYIKAIILGSESNAFKKSSGGLTYAQWERNGLAGLVIIKQVPLKIKEFAKEAILHHNHYIKYAKEVIRTQKRVLRLKFSGNFEEIKKLKTEQAQDTKMATHYNEMTNEILKQLSLAVSRYFNNASEEIMDTQDLILKLLVTISFVVIFFCIIFGIFISRSISKPIVELTEVTEEIANGNLSKRLKIKSKSIFSRSSFPASIFEKSSISLIIDRRDSALFVTESASSI